MLYYYVLLYLQLKIVHVLYEVHQPRSQAFLSHFSLCYILYNNAASQTDHE